MRVVITGGVVEQFNPKLKLISASAGTGKTYTLIQEISETLKNTSADKVVAITFTRAATRDIRNKVKGLGDITVSTIHGFFASILREQAIYFRRSANFRILEEFDEVQLFKNTTATVMLGKLGKQEYETFFAEYEFTNIIDMLLKMEKRYSVIKDKLNTDETKLFEQEKKAEYKKLIDLMPTDLEAELLIPLTSFKGQDGDSLEILRSSVLETVKNLKPVRDISSFYNNIKLLKELIKYDNRTKGSKKNWDSPEEQEQVKEALKKLHELRKQVLEYKLGEEWIAKQASKYRKLFFELFLEAHKAHEQKKLELDTLSYNDIELLTYDLIKNNPNVAKYYQEKYEHIFVDEFQDTNVMQRDVLFAIAKNIFVVGDAKQSIYRFRNADVRVFMDTQSKCNKDELKELKTNWRCLPKIVEAVNTAFPLIFGHSHSKMQRKSFEAEYLGFEPKREDTSGIVKLINAQSKTKHHNSFDHELEAKICLDLINKGLKDGKSYSDFALLFRSSNHMSEFEKLFRDKGVPFVVYGGESRHDLLSSLRSLFNIILNPNDDLSMLEILKLPVFYTDENDIYKLKKDKTSIWESLEAHPIKEFITEMRAKKDKGSFTEFVTEVLRASKFIPTASLIFTGQDSGAEEAILRAAMHVEAEGEGIGYFLDFLYSMKTQDAGVKADAVKLMTVHASKGLEFKVVLMPCLDNTPRPAKDIIVISDDGDVAVKLGDEQSNTKFNTVFYRDIKDYEEEADIAESKRLLYVAMTRAKDELYLISDFDKGNKGIAGKRWVDWLSEIFNNIKQEYKIQDEVVAKAPKVKVIKTLDKDLVSKNLISKKEDNIIKRYSASYIRDQLINYENKKTTGSIGIGTLIHTLLENWDKKDEAEKIYKLIDEETGKTIFGIVNSFATSPLGQKVFSAPKALCEYSFMVKQDSTILSGRIDRINIYDDHIWVMDYKTAVDERDLPAYRAQIECYVKFVNKAFPNKKVIASIVDVTSCKEYKG